MPETVNITSEMPFTLKGAMMTYVERYGYDSHEQLLMNCLAYELYSPPVYREWGDANKVPEYFTYDIHTTQEKDWRPQNIWDVDQKKYVHNPQIILQGKEDQRAFYRGGNDRVTFSNIPADLHQHCKLNAEKMDLSMSKYVAIEIMGRVTAYPKYMDARINFWKDKKWTFADFKRRVGYDLSEEEYNQHMIDIAKFHPMVDWSREPIKVEQPWKSGKKSEINA